MFTVSINLIRLLGWLLALPFLLFERDEFLEGGFDEPD
jgi:hypothetical protein